ncbi:MAG: TetR family transcriptional regulator [Acidimicrobiales bacterium]
MTTVGLETKQGRRERKKAATRRALQRAALALAVEHGVAHVTVEAISDEVGVSPRTFFNYFTSKEEALVGDPPAWDERLRAALVVAPAGSPVLAVVRAVAAEVAQEAAEHRDELAQRKQLVRDCPVLAPRMMAVYAAREQAFAQAIADFMDVDVDRDLFPALLAALAGTAFRVAFQRWDGTSKQRLERLVHQAFDALERGL